VSDPTIYQVYEFLREFIRGAGPRGTINVRTRPWVEWYREGVMGQAVKCGYLIDIGEDFHTGQDRFSVTEAGSTFLDAFLSEYERWLRDRKKVMFEEDYESEYAGDVVGESYPVELTKKASSPADFTVDLRASQREAQERVAAKRLAAQKAADEAKSFYVNNALYGAI